MIKQPSRAGVFGITVPITSTITRRTRCLSATPLKNAAECLFIVALAFRVTIDRPIRTTTGVRNTRTTLPIMRTYKYIRRNIIARERKKSKSEKQNIHKKYRVYFHNQNYTTQVKAKKYSSQEEKTTHHSESGKPKTLPPKRKRFGKSFEEFLYISVFPFAPSHESTAPTITYPTSATITPKME